MLYLLTSCVLSLLCLFPLEANTASQKSLHQDPSLPWFTGPLLTPSAHTVPAGHYNIEPYQFVTSSYGHYTKWWHSTTTQHNLYNVSTQLPLQIGLAKRWDVFFATTGSWNETNGASHWVVNDGQAGVDFQIYKRTPGNKLPSIKLNVQVNLPLGTYQKLQERLKRTDVGGSGSWSPCATLAFSHLLPIKGPIFFAPRLAFTYTVPTPVSVQGLNTYGGGHGTQGTVYPGNNFTALFGYEISLTKKWAFAGDIQYTHINKTRFKGHKGTTLGVRNEMTSPSSESLSIAPAFEYNWSPYYGLIAGTWFSIAGRNRMEFLSGVVALNFYH